MNSGHGTGTLLTLAGFFGVLSLFAVGGGNSAVPEMHRFVVDVQHWLTDRQFADSFALAQLTPGPNIIIVTLIGYHVAGVVGALITTLAMCGPPALFAFFVGNASDRFKGKTWHSVLSRALVPVTIGLTAASAAIIAATAGYNWMSIAITLGTALVAYFVPRASAVDVRHRGRARHERPALSGSRDLARAPSLFHAAHFRGWKQRHMDKNARLNAMAQWMWDARRRRLPYRNLPDDLRPASIAEAYAAQEAYYRLAEPVYGAVAGAKIATTTKVMQQLMGITHPCGGAIFARTIHASPARLRYADFVNLRIESEIALKLGADLPASGAPWTRDNRDAGGGGRSCPPSS